MCWPKDGVILLDQQSCFTKYPCFLWMLDRRDCAQHYTKKVWPLREELVPCKERNFINDPLVDRDRIIFPPLHTKLDLIEQFTKALDKDGDSPLTCVRLFQDWPWRIWKLASLTVIRSGSSSPIQSSKTQWRMCYWKRGSHLFW